MLTVMRGRSRRLWPRVLAEMGEAQRQGAQRLFLITPDQYTLQAELELVDRLALPGLLEMEVLSPSRLLTRVFTLAGSPQRVRIDGRGKAMILTDIVQQSEGELLYYRGAVGRRGFTDRLAASIGDFKRASMAPEDVLALAETFSEGDALRSKLHDMGVLYARYEARLSDLFIDGEDAQEELILRLPDSGLLDGARVWLYGFDMITPQFIRQVAVMAKLAQSVRFAITWEKEDAPDGLVFGAGREALSYLGKHFDAEGLRWEQEDVDEALSAAPEIQHLERQVFAVPPKPYPQKNEAVTLWMASDPYDEAMCAAARMMAFAREKGIAFDEMAVVIGDAEGYAGAVETAFGRSGIPYHLTRTRPAIAHPLIRSWLAALRCATRRWRLDDALDWLKGGFCGLTTLEAERLENYAIENGLRDAKWRKPIEDVALEDIRARFVGPLADMQQRLGRARDTTSQLAAVYQLLEDVDAYGTLERWQEMLAGRGLLTEAAECAQAWRILLETLDQLHALLAGSRIRMRDLSQVVESGFAQAELRAVPASPGMVQVGQLGHMKISGVCRVLFLMGMHDGVMRSDIAALMTDAEAARAMAAHETKAPFTPSTDTLAQLMQVNLLDTLCAPTEALLISHCSTGTGGEAQRPAAVLALIGRVFPGIEEEGSAIAGLCVSHAPGAALDAMGPMLRAAALEKRSLTQTEADTAAWLLHAPRTRAHAEGVLRALLQPVSRQRLGKQAADALYAHSRTSVSRLEAYARCPFRHFVSYGLRPVPRRDFAVARDETGTFYHRAMEGYTKQAAQTEGWPHVSRAENDAIMNAVLSPLKAEWENAPLGDNAMLQATGEAFCRIARRAAWNYAGQMQRGGFQTGVVEARFGPGEPLAPIALAMPDGRTCWVEGRIDRIDFFEGDEGRWLRVVDYKSGATALEPAKLYAGLQLQLLLYLSAALAAFPGVSPAGAFYSRFDDPLVETDSRDVEEIERQIARELRLKGITLSDVRVIEAMGEAESLLKQDQTVRKRNDVMTEAELSLLMAHAHALAGDMAGEIAGGDIAPRPAQLDAWRACQWCDYASICGFDPALEGVQVRTVEKISKDEMVERLSQMHPKG